LEFDKDGYERSKTKKFNKKANATNSDSNEFELPPPEADTSESNEFEFELDPEADTVLSEIESKDEEMIGLKRKKNSNVQTQTHKYAGHPIAVVIDEEDAEATKPYTAAKSFTATKSSTAIKSSVGVDEQKLAAKPSTTGVVVELTDEVKRAKNKNIKEELLQNISQFKAVLGVPNAFGPEHWKVLLSQMENDGNYTNQLFFGRSKDCRGWRSQTLLKARAKLGIGIIQVREGGMSLGETTSMAASSAIEVAKRVTFTHSLHISDDVAVNDVAVGQVVSTLKAFRGGVTPIIPSFLTSYFAVGNQSKARNLVIPEYDSAMMIMAKSYDYETAKKLAVELKDKHDLSTNFRTFTEDSYKNPTQFTSANEIHRMCMLPRDDLHAEVRAFMDKNFTNLMKNSTEYTMAFWQPVISILKSGSTMDDMVGLMANGHGCVVPVIMDVGGEAKKGHAFFTMGTLVMLKKGWMSRFFVLECPIIIMAAGTTMSIQSHIM
jgi:hypothetical protein